MNPVIQTAVSGLVTHAKRFGVSANNVANASSAQPVDRESEAFVPQRVDAVSVAEGGVRGELRDLQPHSTPVFDPDHPAADERGLIALPNVSVEEELVTQIRARRAYEASGRVFAAGARLLGDSLDLKA